MRCSSGIIVFFLCIGSLNAKEEQGLRLTRLNELLQGSMPAPLLPATGPRNLRPQGQMVPPPVSPADGFPEPVLSRSRRIREYQDQGLLFKSGNSDVRRAITQETGISVLLKIYPNWAGAVAKKEASIFQNISHPNILCHLETIKTPSNYVMVFEDFPGETLEDFLTPDRVLTEANIRKIAQQLLSLVSELHNKRWIAEFFNEGHFLISPDCCIKLFDVRSLKQMTRSRTLVLPGRLTVVPDTSLIVNIVKRLFEHLPCKSDLASRFYAAVCSGIFATHPFLTSEA